MADAETFVSVTSAGFGGDANEIAGQAIGATEGSALVLAGAKALLEHRTALDLVRDRYLAGYAEAETARKRNPA